MLNWNQPLVELDGESTFLAIFAHHHGFKGSYVGTTDFVFLFFGFSALWLADDIMKLKRTFSVASVARFP